MILDDGRAERRVTLKPVQGGKAAPEQVGDELDYFSKIHPDKLPRGGLIVCRNAINYKSAMQDYLDFIRQHAEFDTVILSLTMDDGFVLSYRRRR